DDRRVPGHWESDTLLFSDRGQMVLAAHERSSRLTLLVRQPGKAAAPVAEQLARWLAPLPPALRRSITFDNGTEFAEHHRLAALGIPTFFCQLRSPWQKGGVENALGRIRRYLPRKTNLDSIPATFVERVARAYNNTPRKCLGFRTPAEAFQLLHFECESTC
ncbi:IS30 family transposase, partial [Sphingomonas sp. ac-8]|uniref:IS30 family transposase n=1 Tax=Sphingomonas sp. ac-8 TaxID=3242977 RepID=UPI003A807822